jgi:hypothetical protein
MVRRNETLQPAQFIVIVERRFMISMIIIILGVSPGNRAGPWTTIGHFLVAVIVGVGTGAPRL